MYLVKFVDKIKMGEIVNTEWSQGSATGPLGLFD